MPIEPRPGFPPGQILLAVNQKPNKAKVEIRKRIEIVLKFLLKKKKLKRRSLVRLIPLSYIARLASRRIASTMRGYVNSMFFLGRNKSVFEEPRFVP